MAQANRRLAELESEQQELAHLAWLQSELARVQTLKSETQQLMDVLQQDEKVLERLAKREQQRGQPRVDRVQQLQDAERARQEAVEEQRRKDAAHKQAQAEEARLKQERTIRTDHDSEDLDAFLAQDSARHRFGSEEMKLSHVAKMEELRSNPMVAIHRRMDPPTAPATSKDPAAEAALANRKRKVVSPATPGLTRSTKLFRSSSIGSNNGSNGFAHNMTSGMAPASQETIHTSDAFIDHQRAMFSADVAPTPHCPVANMPPTPAFGNRMGSFDNTPTDGSFRNMSASNTPANGDAEATPVNGADDDSTPAANGAAGHGKMSTPSPMPRATPLNLRNFANWNVSSQYTLVRFVGKGSYGQVAEAFDTVRQKKVAIKKIVNVFDQEIDCKRLFREIYILRHLRHPQVISLLDVIPPDNYETFTDLYLVFEFVDTDLHKLIMSPQYLTIRHIQVFLYQLLCGLKYIHSANVIHRDMKPANILLNEDCTLMICDFGLSRVLENNLSMEELSKHLYSPNDAKSPSSDSTSAPSPGSAASTPSSSGDPATKFKRQLTKHVVTRWYRAPELILLQDYSFAVDMWSIGCIFAELLSMQVESCPRYQERVPLFPGRSCFPLSADRPTTYSDKLDQLNVIFNVIGTPGEDDIGSLGEVKQYLRKLPKKDPRDLREMYPGAPADSLDLLKLMLRFNPDCRISVNDALNHPFLEPVRRAQSEAVEENPFGMDFEDVPLNKDALKARIFEEIKIFSERNNR